MPVFNLLPIDDQGLAENRPSTQVKWTKLTNLIFRQGRLRPRPGFIQVVNSEAIPAVERGVPISIFEVLNPGSDDEDRDPVSWVAETLRPNGSSTVVAGWSGSHTDIDDTAPDGSVISSSTTDAQIALDFTNPTISADEVALLILRGRARVDDEGATQPLNFYERTGSNPLIDSVDIYFGRNILETNSWTDFAIPITTLPGSGELSISNLNSLKIGVENDTGLQLYRDYLAASGDGAFTDWDDAVDGGTGTFSDYNARPVDFFTEDTGKNHVVASAAGDKVSFTVSAPSKTTYSTINNVTFQANFDKFRQARPVIRTFYRNAGGTEFTLETITGRQSSTFISIGTAQSTNPDTSSAWTMAEITGGQWGIELISGGLPTLVGVQIEVEGTIASTATMEVDYIAVDILGLSDAGATAGVLGRDRIWVTNKSFLRLDDELTPTVTSVAGTVANPSTGVLPLDHAQLYGQQYMVNGEDATWRFPNASDVFEQLTLNNAFADDFITGKTVTAFADRIFYGWVKDSGNYIPERIAWSNRFNGGEHDGITAGDLDLLDTPGGIVKLAVMTEDVCAVYKQVGVYILRQTGNDAAPIIRDVIDFQTKCLAPLTVKTVNDEQGHPYQLFLGRSPSFGINVYKFDGSQVVPIGEGIQPFLRDDSTFEALPRAYAEVDPDAGLYWLFVPTNTNQVPEEGYKYHLRTGQWTKFEFPYPSNCAGRWTLNLTKTPAADGFETLMIGTMDNVPSRADYTQTSDILYLQTAGGVIYSGEELGSRRQFFTSTIETGDFILNEDPTLHTVNYRLFISYYDKGPFRCQVSASENGGITFNTAKEYFLGTTNADDRIIHQVLDIDPITGRRVRFKVEFSPKDQDGSDDELFEIFEAWIEWEPSGTVP